MSPVCQDDPIRGWRGREREPLVRSGVLRASDTGLVNRRRMEPRYTRGMSGTFNASYPIARSTGVCAGTGRAFAPGERVVAVLAERDGQDEFERQDYSESAWAGGARPAAPCRVFATWRTLFEPGDAKKKLLLSDDELLDLFEQLASAEHLRQISFRAMLAILLVRRRILAYEGESGGLLHVRVRRAAGLPPEPMIQVPNPNLDDATLAGVIEQLSEVVGA